MTFALQSPLDVIDGEILLPERHYQIFDAFAFGRRLRTLRWREEKLAVKIIAELMAQDTEAARRVAKALSDLVGRHIVDEERPERLVLTVR